MVQVGISPVAAIRAGLFAQFLLRRGPSQLSHDETGSCEEAELFPGVEPAFGD